MKISYALLLVSCVTVAFFSSCTHKSNTPQKDLLIENIDTTVKPGDNFFEYAEGGWIKRNPVPASENSWGIWSLVNEDTYARLRKINEESAATNDATPGSNTQKIGDFWITGMDTVAIEKNGIAPLQSELDRIASIHDKESLLSAIAYYQTIGVAPLFDMFPMQDERNSNKYVLHFYQGGLNLPERDYYFDNSTRFKNIRSAYLKHISKMLQLLGEDSVTAGKNSIALLNLETTLAKSSRKIEDLRDPYTNYNKMTVGDFNKLSPSFNWDNLLEKMKIKSIDTVIVGQPEFYRQIELSLKSVRMEDWKTYMRYSLITSFAPYLSRNFAEERFHFYGTVLSGAKEQRPRWKRVLDVEGSLLGDALGQLYIQKYYSAKTKARYEKLVDNVFDAFRDRIKQLDWMSDTTKQKAIAKLNTVTKKVGYPEKWKDYSSMNIDKSSYLQNALNGRLWHYNYEISKLYKPVDKTEWEMTPQTWNAYYNPSNNEIVLPAAVFIIPGWADSLVDDAVIYGYGGASTIGHEITHGFDDQGRQFDEKGNLKSWWTKSDSVRFTKRANMLVKQFDNYVVLDSMHVNGAATLGENIADLGGIVIAYDAFKKTDQYKNNIIINGLTPSQRFFLGYSLSWMGHYRPESLARQIKSDVHSPNFLRVNGPMSDIDAFYEAFHIQPGDKMYLPDSLRVKIW